MFTHLLIAIIAGVTSGTLTGLIPGIHVNLISLLLLSSAASLSRFFSLTELAAFIIAMAVTHSFLDVIPSIFLGAPDSDMILGVLPGHRFLLRGEGYGAVYLTVVGSFFSLVLSLLLIPVLLLLVQWIFPFLQPLIGYILGVIIIYMIAREHWQAALFVFFVSGVLGLLVFSLPLENPLFPLLSGLFGVSTLLYSLKENSCFPEQHFSTPPLEKPVQAVGASTVAGFLTALFPGLGAAQGAVLAMHLVNIEENGFLILTGGINTVNFVLSLVTFFVLDKARNGAIVVVQELITTLTVSSLILFSLVALVAGSVAVIVCLSLAKSAAFLVPKVPYAMLVWGVIGLLVVLTFLLTGGVGFLILFTATAIGFLPVVLHCSRTHAMGCLLLPTLLYFL